MADADEDQRAVAASHRRLRINVPDRMGRWGLAALAGTLVPAVAVLGLFLLGPRPSATTQVHLDPISVNELLDPLTPAAAPEEAMAEQVAAVEGEDFATLIRRQFDFEPEYRVTADAEAATLTITATADTPREALIVAERVADTFVATRQDPSGALAGAEASRQFLEERGASLEAGPDATPPTGEDPVIDEARTRLAALEAGIGTISEGTAEVVTPASLDHGDTLVIVLLLAGLVGVAVGVLVFRSSVVLSNRVDAAGGDAGTSHPVWRRLPLPRTPLGGVQMAVLGALVVARGLVLALFGVGFIVDDWHIADNIARLGPFDPSSNLGLRLRSLPGAWLIYDVAYAISGRHPLILLALGTAFSVGLVIVLYAALRRYTPDRVAFAVAALWVIMPNHNSLTAWGATLQARLALLLLCCGVLAMARGRWVPAAMCFAGAAVSYELTVVPAVALAALLPAGSELRPRDRVKIVAAVVVAELFLRLSPHYPVRTTWPNPVFVWMGHVSSGLFATVYPPLQVRLALGAVVAMGVVACLVSWLRGNREMAAGPSLALAGLAVMLAGLASLPFGGGFLAFAEVGDKDRLYAVSSIGAAMVFVGIGCLIWHHSRLLAQVAGAALVLVCLVGQVVSLRSWSRAGDDGVALMNHLAELSPDPGGTGWVVGPVRPWRNGVITLDTDSATHALRFHYGDGDGFVRITGNEEEYEIEEPDTVRVPWSDVVDDPPQPPTIVDGEVVSPRIDDLETLRAELWCATRTLIRGSGC